MLRTIAGFLLFPLPAALVRALVVWRWPSPAGGIMAHPASMFVAMWLLVFLPELVFGAPLLLFLRRTRRDGLLAHAMAGAAVLGLPFALLAVGLAIASRPLAAPIIATGLAIIAGGLGGLLFRAAAPPPPRADYAAVFT